MGMIYNIQRFSIYDGPGIRTTVFFKGCTLRCLWCHNPESISFHRELEFYPDRCIGCGACVRTCPRGAHSFDASGVHGIDRSACERCMKCAEACFAEALAAVGSDVDTDGLMKSILTDLLYYQSSGGGVTFSGGECMAQAGFLKEALAACKGKGIHTAVDTAGNVPWESFEAILDVTDLFLYDVKAADSAVHARLTGAGNERILCNLTRLSAAGKQITVRIPYIPGLNDAEIEGIAHILKGLAITGAEVMPYHRLGEGKYQALGLVCRTGDIRLPTDGEIQAAVDVLRSHGIRAART